MLSSSLNFLIYYNYIQKQLIFSKERKREGSQRWLTFPFLQCLAINAPLRKTILTLISLLYLLGKIIILNVAL